MENIEKEGLGIAGGLAAVEYGPDMLKGAMKDIIGESNFGQGFSNTELGKIGGNALSWAQGAAPAVAVLGFAYLGLKTMFKGIEFPGKGRAS